MKKKSLFVCLFLILIFPLISLAIDVPPQTLGIPSEASGLPGADVKTIITGILKWLLGVFGTLGIISFVISGIMYLVSAGNDDMISKAKKGMTYSIIGIIVGLSGYIIIWAVDQMLRGSSYF